MKANRDRVGLRKANSSLVLAFVLCAVLLSASVGFAQGQEMLSGMEGEIIPEHYIVVLRDHVVHPSSVARSVGAQHGFAVGHVYQAALKGFSARIPAALLEKVRRDPDVAYIEPDRRVYAVAQTVPTGVRRMGTLENLWANIDGFDDQVDVDIAFLDTGIDLAHPDLNVDVARSTNCARLFGGCIDGQGNDGNGHGTHVAGIAAALDNNYGVVGVAPGARLWAVKVLNNSGSGYLSWIINGIDWVTAHAESIEVASMSLAWVGYSSAAHTAIKNSVAMGIVYFAAAGNESRDIYGDDGLFAKGNDDICPAAFPEVAAVSALHDTNGEPGGTQGTEDDSFASFSNFSASVVPDNPVASPGNAIDLMCPGINIYSTYKNGQYATMSGTSMASPHAAGLAALYIAANGRATDASGVYEIRQALINQGAAQSSTHGLTIQNDRDIFPEPLGWAGTLEDVTDVAITEISAPDSVLAGETATINVTVKNVGTVDVTSEISVTLVDNTAGALIGKEQTILGLAKGGLAEVFFEWDTSSVADSGPHELRALLTNIDDSIEANNSRSITVTVTDGSIPPSVHVADLDGKSKNSRLGFWTATVTIRVRDHLDQPVGAAKVSGVFNDGPSLFQCTTNSTGTCSVQGYQLWLNCLTFTVTDVSASLPYLPEYNTDPDGDSDGTRIKVCR